VRARTLSLIAVGFLGLTSAPSAAASLSWSGPAKLSRGVALTGVTCQSPSLCVAYGNAGRLFVSSRPTDGAATWKVRHIDRTAQLKSVSCPSASLCVAFDVRGNVLMSGHPLRGASSWRRVTADSTLDSLTCPSRSLCIGVDGTGSVIASTDPARAGSWRRFSIGDRSPTYECVHYQDPGECADMSLSGVSCPSAGLCTALDQAGNVVLSTDPAAGPSTWIVAYVEPLDSPSGLTSVGCTSTHFCFGADSWGNFLASVRPAAGQSAWTATGLGTSGAENNPDATLDHMITEAACSSSSACVAIRERTGVFATADPAARAPDWKRTGLGAITSITCAGHGWCFALDVTGGVHATHHTARPQSWSHAFNDASLLDASTRFSCPAARLCVAVDELGRVATGRRDQRRR
jgi:hypothetical protein